MAKDFDKEDGVWRTIGGRKVFIRKGQSVADAMKESGKFKRKNDDNNPPSSPSAVKKDNEEEKSNWTKDDYIKRNKDLEEAKKRVHKQYDDDMADARQTGNDKLEESAKKSKEQQLADIDRLQKENLENYKSYKVKQGNPIEDMANDRVKEKQNTLQMNKMLLENMNKNNIDKLPDGTTKDDLEYKIWENQNYVDKANNNFENLKKNTISEAEKEKYMKDNNLTMFTSRDEYNYLKNKANQSTNDYGGNKALYDLEMSKYNSKEKLERAKEKVQNKNISNDERQYYQDYIEKREGKPIKDILNENKSTKETKQLASNSGQEKINDNTKVMNYGGTYIVTQNGANKGEFGSQKEAEDFAKSLSTNETMNNAIREKASKKKEVEEDLPKHTEIKSQGTSNRKEVSENIQAHILDHYDSPEDFIEQMDAYDWKPTNWHRGEALAEDGFYEIYYDDQRKFLDDLKINPKGKDFDDDRVFQTYKSLIGRESAKLYERIKRNQYKQYKKDHPLTQMTFEDFKDMKK